MKYLVLLCAFFICSTSMAATLNCATAMGGYDEVQKFQIKDNREVWMSGKLLESSCDVSDDTIECEFKTDQSSKSYTVLVDLNNLNDGVIDQILRSSHPISCKW